MAAAANPVSALGTSSTSLNKSGNRNTTPYEFESFPDFDSFDFDRYAGSYPNLVAFVKRYFSTRKPMFNPLKSLYDPFIQGTTGADGRKTYTDFYQWYIEKKPSFGSNKDLYIPEYEIALVQMCRDLLFVHSKGKYIMSNNARRKTENIRKTKKNAITHANIEKLVTKNNGNKKELLRKTYGITKIDKEHESEILNLLEFINSKLPDPSNNSKVDAFKYEIFMEIIYNFLQIMSFHSMSGIHDLDSGIEVFKTFIKNSTLVLFPTYMQIDFKIVLLLSASPVINFRLTNRFRFIHADNLPPISEIEHDIFCHGIMSHKIIFGKNNKNNRAERFNLGCKTHFTKMKELISVLKPYFDYNEKDANIYLEFPSNEKTLVITNEQNDDKKEIMSENQKQVCYCLLLFMIIHELNIEAPLYKYLKTYLGLYTSFNDFLSQFNNFLQPGGYKKLEDSKMYIYSSVSIFQEQNINKATSKFKFLTSIDYKNVFLNFMDLLFRLKDKIDEINKIV